MNIRNLEGDAKGESAIGVREVINRSGGGLRDGKQMSRPGHPVLGSW